MRNNFEERRQNRIDYAKAQAAKKAKEAEHLHREADKMAAVIPMGQPILVGHHSEKGHRNYLKKIHNKTRKAFETEDKAKYYEDKAESITQNDAIFSDDPEALEKLRAKLKSLQENQEFMKAANKCIRKKDKEAFLKIPFATEEKWKEVTTPDVMGGIGFADYSLKNNNANMATVRKRIVQLERQAQRHTTETLINDVRLVENVEANRVQLFFDAIPAKEIREKLHSYGFRWSRSEGAWQRHLTNNAVYVATTFLQQLPTFQ